WLTRADRATERRARDYGYQHLRTRDVMELLTKLGDERVLIVVVVVAAAVVFARRRPRAAVFVPVVSLTGGLLNRVAKASIGRERPSPYRRVIVVHGQGFPSGHAMGATVVFGAVLFVVWPRLSRPVRVAA